ncbi:DUF6283 family protein [Gordonia malaquae]|uniref:DUF6283 family protein n=1 Tax=Gordonia malaquae TaxID=410332 RepID=UPI00301B3319
MAKVKVTSPAPRPCESCPYRRDVPSGVWAESEYEKLRAYDAPTGEQPVRLFLCHQYDGVSEDARVVLVGPDVTARSCWRRGWLYRAE